MTVRPHARINRREKKEDAQNEQTRSPRFSVILCTYNRRNLVLAALACLRRQTISSRNFEVIVVDNGSQDGTLNAVNSFVQMDEPGKNTSEESWQVQCLYEPRSGLAHARNTGLLAASGQIAVFVDDDTLIDPHMLERLWQTYQETGADAVGVRVAVHWDSKPPHWMINDLLETLGQFAPSSHRIQMAPGAVFASCAFSVKLEALRSINYFSPLLSKRATLPASIEVADLCQRLHQAGYHIWYEPLALVLHRVTFARLQRAFFVGRSYWQGRSEIMLQYRHTRNEDGKAARRELLQELLQFARCFFVQSPLISLAGRATSERLLASMEQAHSWGRFIQRFFYLEHVPQELETPAVFFVRPATPDASFEMLTSALEKQDVRYLVGMPDIPLDWLWRHRMYRDQPVGILHFYRPGALELTRRQEQQLSFRLWLARRLGVRVVVTDEGGWWQSARGPYFRGRRTLERKFLHASNTIVASTHQPRLLYRERRLAKRVRSLPQPGFRGHYPPALAQDEAREALGLPSTSRFVYLCLAHQHTEREILLLLEAFHLLTQGGRHEESLPDVQLVVAGHPIDCERSSRMLKLAARDLQIYLKAEECQANNIPLYMGACDTVVLPHLAVHTAGLPSSATLALSYHLLVVAPDLPRFSGMLPQRASLPYVPGSRESLAEAMIKAQQMNFFLQEEEELLLDAEQGWKEYTADLLNIYHELLKRKHS